MTEKKMETSQIVNDFHSIQQNHLPWSLLIHKMKSFQVYAYLRSDHGVISVSLNKNLNSIFKTNITQQTC